MELPTTIEGCLEALRNKPSYSDDSDEAIDYRIHQHANAATVATPRLNEIVDIVRTLPKEALCAPKSTGAEILSYIEFCDWQKQSQYPYSGKFTDAYLHAANDKNPELLHLEYVNGEDDGYPEYGRIDVPTSWLVCPAEELKKLVLNKIYDDLLAHIDKLRREVDKTEEAKDMLWDRFSEYLISPPRQH